MPFNQAGTFSTEDLVTYLKAQLEQLVAEQAKLDERSGRLGMAQRWNDLYVAFSEYIRITENGRKAMKGVNSEKPKPSGKNSTRMNPSNFARNNLAMGGVNKHQGTSQTSAGTAKRK